MANIVVFLTLSPLLDPEGKGERAGHIREQVVFRLVVMATHEQGVAFETSEPDQRVHVFSSFEHALATRQ